jgi:hypothetical protein
MAMKRFLLRLVGFLSIAAAGCAILLVAVVVLNRQSIDNCRLDQGVDSVVVGDSHTAWAIDAAGIDGVQNISLNAEGYKYTYAKLRHLLRTEPTVRRIYLGFSYHNLSAYYDDYIVGPTFRQFIHRYRQVLEPADYIDLASRDPAGVADLFLRVVRNGLSAPLRGGCSLYGRFSDEPMTAEFDLSTMNRRITEQYYVDGRVQAVSSLNLEYLEKIVHLANEHRVDLVMLNTPMHAQYKSRVPAKFVELYDSFLREHRLRSFEFHDLQLSDAEFLPDGDHTNYRGAVLASRRFAEFHLGGGFGG